MAVEQTILDELDSLEEVYRTTGCRNIVEYILKLRIKYISGQLVISDGGTTLPELNLRLLRSFKGSVPEQPGSLDTVDDRNLLGDVDIFFGYSLERLG